MQKYLSSSSKKSSSNIFTKDLQPWGRASWLEKLSKIWLSLSWQSPTWSSCKDILLWPPYCINWELPCDRNTCLRFFFDSLIFRHFPPLSIHNKNTSIFGLLKKEEEEAAPFWVIYYYFSQILCSNQVHLIVSKAPNNLSLFPLPFKFSILKIQHQCHLPTNSSQTISVFSDRSLPSVTHTELSLNHFTEHLVIILVKLF